MEDELAGSIREIKPVGQADLLRERFDSVFRRNLVEPDAPWEFDKKRQKKQKYKFKARQGAAFGGTVSERLMKKTRKGRQQLDDLQGKQDFLRDDLILI